MILNLYKWDKVYPDCVKYVNGGEYRNGTRRKTL